MLKNKLHVVWPCAFLIAIVMLAPTASAAGKAVIAIYEFENKSGNTSNIGASLATMMTTELSKLGKFEISDRTKLGTLADEQLLGESGLVSWSTKARTGRVKGAQYILNGTITRAEVQFSKVGFGSFKMGKTTLYFGMDISFIDAETSEVKFAETVTREDKRSDWGVAGIKVDVANPAFEALAREVIKGLAEEITMSVFPSRVMDYAEASKQVVFSYGEDIYTVGDVVRILDTSGSFIDPDTGDEIPRKIKIGTLVVTSVEEEYSTGEILTGTAFMGAVCEITNEEQPKAKKKGSLFERKKKKLRSGS